MPRIYSIMFVVSMVLVITAAGVFLKYGLRFGVDFTGGSVLELQFTKGRPPMADLQKFFSSSEDKVLRDLSLTPAGEKDLILRSGDRTTQLQAGVLTAVQNQWPDAGVTQLRFDFIGPAIGSELRTRAVQAIVLALIVISLYIALVFRAMRRTLSWWVMSFGALIALAHDILLPMGVFALLGHFRSVEVNAVFLAAILTIMGYSISDTVVVFDRVRENVIRGMPGSFGETVHRSVMQTLVRSINTNVTVLISLVAIYFFGGESIRYFSLALIVGIFSGAYSSIFVASPILVWLSRTAPKRR